MANLAGTQNQYRRRARTTVERKLNPVYDTENSRITPTLARDCTEIPILRYHERIRPKRANTSGVLLTLHGQFRTPETR